MNEEALTKIETDERYHRLIRQRSRLGWLLAAIIFIAYFSFTALIAFDKALLASPTGDGVTSLGIPIGFGLILLAILLTGIYVRRANSEFDRLTREIVLEVEA
jgi:uncharacterized membrane protein (DUF485 family)